MQQELRVLIVDDEDDFREIIAKRLARRGVKVWLAACCAEALASLAAEPVDVVVLDVRMPGEDGIECLSRIKEKWPKLPVIMLTGHASVSAGVTGIRLGAFDYCIKPVTVDDLLEKIILAHQAAG